MKIAIRIDTKEAQARLREWGGRITQRSRVAVEKAMRQVAPAVSEDIRAHVAAHLSVARKAFLKSFRTKVYATKKDRFPALWVGSKVPWVGIHERGGMIKGKMLIPLHGRIGRKHFKRMVQELMRGGNAFFVRSKKGQVILMAENLKEHDAPLRKVKRQYRKAEGIARLKRGQAIPIAVLVSQVSMRKRINVAGRAQSNLKRIAAAVQAELVKL